MPRKGEYKNTIGSIEERLRRFEQGHLICLVWPGSKRGGYGKVRYRGALRSVHNLLWEAKHGPVPDGMDLDHVCRNPACGNVAHLRLLTTREHLLGHWNSVAYRNARKPCCPTCGGDYESILQRGVTPARVCRPCQRRGARERKGKK